jgi:hypothetical protein
MGAITGGTGTTTMTTEITEAGAGEKAVHVAMASGDEKGKASVEQQGRNAHQDKHRGAGKHQDKQRGKELHTRQ